MAGSVNTTFDVSLLLCVGKHREKKKRQLNVSINLSVDHLYEQYIGISVQTIMWKVAMDHIVISNDDNDEEQV